MPNLAMGCYPRFESTGEGGSDHRSERREQVGRKPWILRHPKPIAWRGVGQRNMIRQVLLKRPHGLRQVLASAIVQVVSLSVLTDQQREADLLQGAPKLVMPEGRTFLPRRQVARFPFAGITEAHRNQGNSRRVVKRGLIDARPFTKLSAARVHPRNSALVNFGSGRLADDEQPSRSMRLNHRTWPMRQMMLAFTARTNFGEQPLHRKHGGRSTGGGSNAGAGEIARMRGNGSGGE